MAMSLEMFMVTQVENEYPISSQYKIYYYNYTKGDLVWNYINVYVLTRVYRFQYPILSSKPGISSSLEVVIKYLNSEMLLRSNVLWYDVEV